VAIEAHFSHASVHAEAVRGVVQPNLLGPDEYLHRAAVDGVADSETAQRTFGAAITYLSRKENGVADDARHTWVVGPAVNDGGGVELDEPSGSHHRHLVRQRQRLRLIVSDQHRRRAGGAEGRSDGAPGSFTQARIQRGERCVEQHNGRFGSERACQGHPLLLPKNFSSVLALFALDSAR
jgi:hypothetical protein